MPTIIGVLTGKKDTQIHLYHLNCNKLIPGPVSGQNPGYFLHFSPQIQTHGASRAITYNYVVT